MNIIRKEEAELSAQFTQNLLCVTPGCPWLPLQSSVLCCRRRVIASLWRVTKIAPKFDVHSSIMMAKEREREREGGRVSLLGD